MDKNKIYITVTALFLLYLLTVLFFCLYNFTNNNINLAEYFFGIRLDRVFHFLMFLPYPFVCWLFFNYNKYIKIFKEYTFAAIILSGILFASMAEASQELLTTYRDSDPYDLAANITGILIGSLLVYILKGLLSKIFDFIFRKQS
ncbi:MAG: VanZ family protein [Bacteroidales bacterium]